MNILELDYSGLEAFVVGLGEPRFRAVQVWEWLWAKGARDFASMTNLPKGLREHLGQQAEIVVPRLVRSALSSDGTAKLLLSLSDNELVETVLITDGSHVTQCLSTQVGCALGCTFCNTGLMGLTRNMTHAEITGQVLAARDFLAGHGGAEGLRNLVFMGMGEPLLNLEALLASLGTLYHPKGLNFSPRRVTVSTAGVPGALQRFAETGLAGLAVSLHAPNQELRARLMPGAARMYPLDRLIADLENYPLKARDRLTVEYVLLGGVNDSPEQARELVRLLAGVKCKINLIAYNESEGLPYRAPDQADILAFQKVLWDKGLVAVLRKSKGRDISAACGQLKAEHCKGDEIRDD